MGPHERRLDPPLPHRDHRGGFGNTRMRIRVNPPARHCTGGLGLPPNPDPMDFAARFQVVTGQVPG